MSQIKRWILVCLILLVGCASPWEQNFQINPTLESKFSPTDRVELRDVEFARLERYEKTEQKLRTESTTAPADYTSEQRESAKNRLLEALQLKDRGDEIEIIGWSRFADTTVLDLHGKELETFAKKVGADVVVSTSVFTGQVNRVVDYPLTSYSNYYTTFSGPRGRQRTFTSAGHSTVWVPTPVTEDQYFYEAVFLRRHGQ
jgi:hypothetical protein